MSLTESKELLRVCPDCGSLSVDYSTLEGGEATCNACGWKGRKDDLFSFPVSHELGSSEEILISMYNGWRDTFGKFSTDVARFLLQWGFLVGKREEGKLRLDSKLLARYVSTAASTSLAAILEERQKIEKEKVRGN